MRKGVISRLFLSIPFKIILNSPYLWAKTKATKMGLNRNILSWWAMIILLLSGCKSTQFLPRVNDMQMLTIDQQIQEDTAISNYIQPFKLELEAKMNKIIGEAPEAMLHNRNLPETELSNFFVDALLDIGQQIDPGVDFSIATKDGIRASIPQGPVTVRSVFELMPFENFITILELRGRDVLRLADFIAETNGQPVGGADIQIHDGKTVSFRIAGKEIDPEATYKLVTYDFIANGGDLVKGLDQPVNRIDTDQRVRDSLTKYIQQLTEAGKQVESKRDGRVKIVE